MPAQATIAPEETFASDAARDDVFQTEDCSIDSQILGHKRTGSRVDMLTDHLGSVTAETNSSGVRTYRDWYSPYGNVLNTSGGYERFVWVGSFGYRDAASSMAGNYLSYYVRARHYSRTLGRWTTVDPIWPDEYPYDYVNARPLYSIDPTGEFPAVCAAACAGAAVCIIDLVATCSDWTGFSSFEACAWETFKQLPPSLQAGCGLGLGGCLACVGRALVKPKPGPVPSPQPGGPAPTPLPSPGKPGPGSGAGQGSSPRPQPSPGRPTPSPGKPKCEPDKSPPPIEWPRRGTPRPSDRRFPPGRRYRNCKSAFWGCGAFTQGGGGLYGEICGECFRACKLDGMKAWLEPNCRFWEWPNGVRPW